MIGFTSRKYIASKPTGEVLVNVAILSGALSHNIPVTLKTVGDSAVGEFKCSGITTVK